MRDIRHGELPHPDSVRLEDYVNYFYYAYPTPPPGAQIPFEVDVALAPHPLGRDLALLRVGVQAEAAPEWVKVPTHLVYLIDVSGSMRSEDRLPLAKTLAIASLDLLEPDDRVSIVTYANGTELRLPPTPVRERETIEQTIEDLVATGGTYGESGIHLAYAQAEAAFVEGGYNHLVLMTDGDFNIGVSDTDELVELIEEKRRSGVTMTALGFGRGNLNDAMMERISNAGNGIYSVIFDEEQAHRYVERRMLSTIRHVAKDLKIQLELNPEHALAYRLLGYSNRVLSTEEFRDDAVDGGEIGAEHRVTALYEIVLPHQSIPDAAGEVSVRDGGPVEGRREIDSRELVQVRVRWKDLGAREDDRAHEIVSSLGPEDLRAADADLRWAAAIAAFAEILHEGPYARPEDLDVIAAIVAAQASRDDDRARFAERFEVALELIER